MAAKEIRTQNGPKFLIFRLSENNDSERFGLEKSSSCGSIQRKYKSHRYYIYRHFSKHKTNPTPKTISADDYNSKLQRLAIPEKFHV